LKIDPLADGLSIEEKERIQEERNRQDAKKMNRQSAKDAKKCEPQRRKGRKGRKGTED